MTDYEMALSEIKMYKKAYENLSENLTHANKEAQRYKAERDKCLKDIEQLRETLIKTQNLADELVECQVKYINLTNHIRTKAEVNPSVSRYIDLVNYIDKLEGGENEV